MTRIILTGYVGRMGHVIRDLADGMPDVTIVAGVDPRSEEAEFPTYTCITDCREEADVIIDFSSPKALDDILSYAAAHSTAAVLCTTGYSPEQIAAIEAASAKLPILRSANMSLGINTVARLIAEAARILGNNGYDIEIVERHHNRKLDAPSGTALLLADAMQKVLDGDYEYVYDRSGRREPRPRQEIGISSVRGGSIVGDHEIIFAGPDEVIEIKHTAYSRSIFGKGALTAALFLAGKPAGLYTMADVTA